MPITINLVCIPSRLEHKYHSSVSDRADSPGGVENLGQKKERTFGRRERRTAVCRLKHHQSTQNPFRLKLEIVHPTRPKQIPRVGEAISGSKKNEPSGGGKGEQPYPDWNIIDVPKIHLGYSSDSFIRVGQSGFPEWGRQSRAEKRANHRAEGNDSSRRSIENPSISLEIHLG